MEKSNYQQVLPDGLELGQPPGGAGVFGNVYEVVDKRLDSQHPTQRIVRFLAIEESNAAWRRPLLERLRLLTAVGIPHVSTPLEIAIRADVVYIITDRYEHRLWDRLPESNGLDATEANQLLKQILSGLAELHNRGIAHGDVRTKNVYVSTAGGQQSTAWLVDTSIGPMTWWSGGKSRDADARRHYPPEWEGKTSEPSFKADLYAFGLMACELFLGRKADTAKGGAAADAKGVEVRCRLRKAGVPRGTRKLLDCVLVDNPEERPRDAIDAARQWEKLERRDHWRMPVVVAAAIAAILLLIVGLGARSTAKRLAEAESRIAELDKNNGILQDDFSTLKSDAEQRITAKEGEIDDLRIETAKQKAEIDRLRQLVPEEKEAAAEVAPEDLRKTWTDFVKVCREKATDKTVSGFVTSVIQRGEKADPACLEYCGEIRKFYHKPFLAVWLRSDGDLSQYVEEYLRAPWDSETRSKADARHSNLEEAKMLWRKWASPNSMMTWANIEGQIEGNQKPIVRAVLRMWFNDVKKHPAMDWTIRLGEARCSEGYGRNRIITVGAGPRSDITRKHAWKSDTSHDYSTTPKDREFRFEWRPDEEFRLCLEEDYPGPFDEDIVAALWDKPIKGPLAVWYANYLGIARSKDNWLTFEIADCPGPPREAFSRSWIQAANNRIR